MDGLSLFPLMLLVTADKPEKKALFPRLLPALIPGSSTQRLVVATISARKQIKSEAETEQGLVSDAIKAAKFQRPADLAPFQNLDAAFKRLPASVQSTIFQTAPAGGGTKSGGNET
jgi:hypothetical protein